MQYLLKTPEKNLYKPDSSDHQVPAFLYFGAQVLRGCSRQRHVQCGCHSGTVIVWGSGLGFRVLGCLGLRLQFQALASAIFCWIRDGMPDPRCPTMSRSAITLHGCVGSCAMRECSPPLASKKVESSKRLLS